MPTHDKLFTLEEANALIPSLEALLTRIQIQYVKIEEILSTLREDTPPERVEQHLHDHPEIRPLFDEIQRCVAAIEETGAIFKGVELGLIDFPWLNGDEVALLCYQAGEKEIRWWHSMEGGFSARRPLPGAGGQPQWN